MNSPRKEIHSDKHAGSWKAANRSDSMSFGMKVKLRLRNFHKLPNCPR
jgi:hypothetical protein